MMPLVSVLMPVRNGLPWLEDALCGLSSQTVRDIEILADWLRGDWYRPEMAAAE